MKQNYNYSHATKEIMRCLDTFIRHFTTGYTLFESEQMVRGSYGDAIVDSSIYYLKNRKYGLK